jgi:mRNA-degrading endonuclease RelE of RelBE toxin-antitoxin system
MSTNKRSSATVLQASTGLHAGDIRILYEVDDEAATVYIINIGVMS